MNDRDRKRGRRPPWRRPARLPIRPLPRIDLSPAPPEPQKESVPPPEAPTGPQAAAPPEPPLASHASAGDFCFIIGLLLLATVAFLPTLSADFLADDYLLVVNNDLLRRPADVAALFARPFLPLEPNSYHPLASVTYFTDFQVWRNNPIGYHTTSLTLHLIATLLVYVLATGLLARREMAFAAGAVFAVHPIHVSTVSWVARRPETLATCLALLSFVAYALYVNSFRAGAAPGAAGASAAAPGPCRGAARPRRRYYWVSAVLFILALFAHASAGMMLALLALYELTLARQRFQTQHGAALWLPYCGLAAGGAVYLAARWWALGRQVAPGFDPHAWPAHLYTAPLWAMRALEGLLLPLRFQPFSAARLAPGLLQLNVLAATAALALVVILAVRLRSASAAAAFAAWWALLTLLPSLNLIPLTSRRLGEQGLYLPSVGVALLVGWGVVRLDDLAAARGRAWLRLAIVAAFAAAITLGALTTWHRSGP